MKKAIIKNTVTGFSKVQTDETLRETISHGKPDYAFEFYDESMDMFDFRLIDWHWHSELEIMLVKKGTVDCFAGTENFVLNEGEAIFINTKVIHKFSSNQNAIVPNFLFAPCFISSEDSLIYKKFILPVLHASTKCVKFSSSNHSHKKIIELLEKIIQVQKQDDLKELKTKQVLIELWGQIYRNIDFSNQVCESGNKIRGQAQLQMMMQYIHQNYAEAISLEDISNSVNVSKSTALNIFTRYLNDTPVNYLVSVRLKKAAELLKSTENKIDFIAMETGFESDAYFCRCFKKHFGMTPGMYRKNNLVKGYEIGVAK